MTVKNSKMSYSDEPNYRAFNLAKIGIADIPVLYFIRHTKRLAPIEPHYHKGCFEIGLCLRGSLQRRAAHAVGGRSVFQPSRRCAPATGLS
jgi:hypothetical protein